jgi:hypothetical protein
MVQHNHFLRKILSSVPRKELSKLVLIVTLFSQICSGLYYLDRLLEGRSVDVASKAENLAIIQQNREVK